MGGRLLQGVDALQKYLNQRNKVIVEEFTHPSTGSHTDVHLDPEEIKHAVIEGLKHTKVSDVA